MKLHHAGASSCSQKVRLALAHKGLTFESHPVDLIAGEQHSAEYIKLNPNHVVPTLEDHGHVLIESTLINEYLEDTYPEVAMLPTDPFARHACRLWVKHIDENVQSATAVVTYAIGARNALLQLPKEALEASLDAIPSPQRRASRRSVIQHGIQAPEFGDALFTMVDLLDRFDAALHNSTWISSDAFSLADAAALPQVLRLDHLAMTSLIDDRPNLSRWYQQVQSMDAYQPAIEQWLAPPAVQMFKTNGEAVWPEVEALLKNA